MTIYSLYIFDRHCSCVYYQDWHRTKHPRPAAEGTILNAVSSAIAPSTADAHTASANSPRNTLARSTGTVADAGGSEDPSTVAAPTTDGGPKSNALTFDEEAKLVYGVTLTLRNMIKKLSKREELFMGYRTSTYRLHLYETLSGYKFIMLSDPSTENLRFVLRQIYSGPFVDFVVRNPLISMDSREHGIDNEYFRASVDRMIRGLTVFN